MALISQVLGGVLQVDGRATEGGIIEIVPGARLLLDVGVDGVENGALLDEIAAAVVEAKAARDEAVDISGISTTDAAVKAGFEIPGSQSGAYLSATFATAADALAVQRLDRKAIAKAVQGGGAAAIDYADAPELAHDWANLTGWQAAANAQVSGNRLYSVNGNNPGGALKGFSIGAGQTGHFTTLLYWKSGASTPAYFGLDFGTLDHAPAASSPDGIFIGLNSAGQFAKFMGSGVSAIQTSVLVNLGATSVAADKTFHLSIDVLTDYISFTIRDVADSTTVSYFYVTRNSIVPAGKAINNVALFMQDARATSGHAFGPVMAVKSRQPTRTKTLGGQTVEGVQHRYIATAPSPGGDPWRIQIPKTYDPRTPSPVVIWCHQSLSGDYDDPWTEARMRPLQAALANAGFIFASAQDGGDRWGNQTSLDNYQNLYEHIRARWNTGPLFMIGVSMGFLPVLNSLSHRSLPTPAGVVSIGGVCDLDLLWQQSAYDDGIATAYAISGPDAPDAEYETKTAGYNPMDRAGWEFRGVPMRFYSGSGDTVVTTAGHAQAMSTKVAPYAPEATVVSIAGGHLADAHYVADLDADSVLDIVEFFQAYS